MKNELSLSEFCDCNSSILMLQFILIYQNQEKCINGVLTMIT